MALNQEVTDYLSCRVLSLLSCSLHNQLFSQCQRWLAEQSIWGLTFQLYKRFKNVPLFYALVMSWINYFLSNTFPTCTNAVFLYCVFQTAMITLFSLYVFIKARGMALLRWPSRPWNQAPCLQRPSCKRLRSWRNSDTTNWCLCTPWCLRNPSTSLQSLWAKVKTE